MSCPMLIKMYSFSHTATMSDMFFLLIFFLFIRKADAFEFFPGCSPRRRRMLHCFIIARLHHSSPSSFASEARHVSFISCHAAAAIFASFHITFSLMPYRVLMSAICCCFDDALRSSSRHVNTLMHATGCSSPLPRCFAAATRLSRRCIMPPIFDAAAARLRLIDAPLSAIRSPMPPGAAVYAYALNPA